MKKQVLTFAALAAMAVGAAVASNKSVAPNARLSTDTSTTSCNTNVDCHPSITANCSNEELVEYVGADPISGICDQPMSFE